MLLFIYKLWFSIYIKFKIDKKKNFGNLILFKFYKSLIIYL